MGATGSTKSSLNSPAAAKDEAPPTEQISGTLRARDVTANCRMARISRVVMAAAIAFAVALPLSRAEANGFANTAFIQPDDLVAFQGFGGAVAADGNIMAIGVQFPPFAVYVYVNNNGTWSLQTIINGPDDSDLRTSVKVIGDLVMVTAYDDLSPGGVQTGDAFIYTRGGSTWTEQPDLYMAPGFNGIPGPGQVEQRFGNFATMTKAGSQTIFVIGSQTYSNPDALRVGAVYTAVLH